MCACGCRGSGVRCRVLLHCRSVVNECLRSLKESVNRSMAGAALPRAAAPGALWLLVRNAQGMAGA